MGPDIPLYELPPPKQRSDLSSFDFCQHCINCGINCGQNCLLNYPKHPDQWKRIVVCRTVDRKEELLTVCDERGDEVAAGVCL